MDLVLSPIFISIVKSTKSYLVKNELMFYLSFILLKFLNGTFLIGLVQGFPVFLLCASLNLWFSS